MKVKWFEFRYIYVKLYWINDSRLKINSRSKSYNSNFSYLELILKEKPILFKYNKICQNQLYTSEINFATSKIETKYWLIVLTKLLTLEFH